MADIHIDFNAGMERIFAISPSSQRRINLARPNAKYEVNLFIDRPGTSTEKRRLVFIKKATGEEFNVQLNNSGGQKPTQNNVAIHSPNVRPIHQYGFPTNPETERAFFAEENLTDQPGVSVILRITPSAVGTVDDLKRFFEIRTTSASIFAAGEEVNLKGGGGKKPLGGGFFMLKGGQIIPVKKQKIAKSKSTSKAKRKS